MDFLIGAGAAVGAVIITNPLDVIKTRLQLQGELKAPGQYTKVYGNVLHGVSEIIKVCPLIISSSYTYSYFSLNILATCVLGHLST